MKTNELIKRCVYNTPLILLSVTDKNSLREINSYLPFSTGFEIECNKKKDFDLTKFNSIPDIMHIDIDSGEQRFRIPNGLAGLICLYNICEQLKVNSELNPMSGIHYHIDMTDCFNDFDVEFMNENEKWVLEELDTWNYKGTYNKRSAYFSGGHQWIRFQSCFKTAEIRIGEMSFDYNLLATRIIHANKIIFDLKDKLNEFYNKNIVYAPVNKDNILSYIKTRNITYDVNDHKIERVKEQLANLEKEEKPKTTSITDIKNLIKQRQGTI